VRKSYLLLIGIVALAACSVISGDGWYIRSKKTEKDTDYLTLEHNHKTYVVKCKGLVTGKDFIQTGSCGYLTQHVGDHLSNGAGWQNVEQMSGSLNYYTERTGIMGTYEVWDIMEEKVN
jgi:hypothetical protein